MLNVAISTPSYGYMRTAYNTSIVRMMLHYMGTPVFGRESEPRAFAYNVQQGSMVASQRQLMVQWALDHNASHILFVDEDMGFAPNVLNQLLSRQMSVVTCNYIMKIWPKTFTARNMEEDGWIATTADKDSLEECSFSGMGMALIEREALLALPVDQPWFQNLWEPEYHGYSTEDRSFCKLLKSLGYPTYIDHRASKLVYHVGDHSYSWDDDPMRQMQGQPYAERTLTS